MPSFALVDALAFRLILVAVQPLFILAKAFATVLFGIRSELGGPANHRA